MTSHDDRFSDPRDWTATTIADQVRRGKVSATAVCRIALDRIEQRNGPLNAFSAIEPELAMEQAHAVDASMARGENAGRLAGVPIGVKDLHEQVAGMRTTDGSRLYIDAPIASADGVHVARLRAAGAVVVGRTTAAEFGLDASTATDGFGITRNAWNPRFSPGGSSGGSATAVASGMLPLATGSDSGGSIRAPASHTGLVGFKPSFGRIPQIERWAPINALGVLAKTVDDVLLHLQVAVGPDSSDAHSLPATDRDFHVELPACRSLRVLFSPDLGYIPVDPQLVTIARAAAERLAETLGVPLLTHPLSMPNPFIAYVSLAFDDLRRRLSERAKAETEVGVGARLLHVMSIDELFTSDAMHAAHRMRSTIEARLAELFGSVDLVITPVTAVPAHPADVPTPHEHLGVSLAGIGSEAFPMWGNFGGCPSISLPAGTDANGMPVGMLVTGPRLADALVLGVAKTFERACPWPLEAPFRAPVVVTSSEAEKLR